jgi:tRNA modification GTPase
LREARDEVERIGVERSWQAIAGADAVLFIHDLTRWTDPAYQRDEARVEQGLPEALRASDRLLHVFNKVDAAPAGVAPGAIALSAKTGQGLDSLRQRLLALAGWHAQPEGLFIARTRHVQALRRTQDHLLQATRQLAAADPALDLLAEDLRLAHDALGEITGAVSADQLLGEIFSRFCIGK